DHEDFIATQIALQNSAAAAAGNGGDLLALLMIIGERAGLEALPEIEVAQLDLRSQPDIAGEQAEQRRLRQRRQVFEKLTNSGANVPLAVAHHLVEAKHITVEESFEIGWCRRYF